MIRSILATMAIAVALLAALASGAAAQDCRDAYNTVITCASPTPASGYAESFQTTGGPSTEVVHATADATADADAAASDADAPELAFTGADSGVLTLAGAGLIATGAVAVTARRRIERDQA